MTTSEPTISKTMLDLPEDAPKSAPNFPSPKAYKRVSELVKNLQPTTLPTQKRLKFVHHFQPKTKL
jgi:hypothetical protein